MRRLIGTIVVLIVGFGTASASPIMMGNTTACFISTTAMTLQGQTPPKDGLVSRWAFDETSGEIAYDSAGRNNGALRGCSWTTGVFGGAISLDGLNDFVEVWYDPSLDMTDEMAIIGWVYQVSHANCVILCKQPTNSLRSNYPGNYEFNITVAGTLRFGYETAVGNNEFVFYQSRSLVTSGVWHHVAVTLKKGGNVVFYLDGREVGTFTQLGDFGLVNLEPVRIGTRRDFPNFFYGFMDDLCLYRRALSAQEIAQIWTPVLGDIYYVNGVTGNNWNEGRDHEHAFATIQKGIDAAKDGDTVLVYPGVYAEAVSFKGKAITVQSAQDAAIIESPGLSCVTCSNGEGPRSVLKNFVIRNCQNGVLVTGGMPTLKNLTIVSCWSGIKALAGLPGVSNCILWSNTDADLVGCGARYSCVQKDYLAIGNISADPLFADPLNGDYHLRSAAGMYSPLSGIWITGDVTSPCIDAGDPADNYSLEPKPNGGRIDMGAHGGTPYASRSMAQP